MARREARHGGDEGARILVLRTPQDVVRRPLLDQLALPHHRDAVGDLRHHAEIMRDEQDGGAVAALQLLEQAQDLRLGGDVERGGRLVGNDERGFQRQRHGDHDPLALAARKLVRVACENALGLGQAHVAEHLDDALAALGRAHARCAPR